VRTDTMKTQFFPLLFILLIWNCKEKPDTVTQDHKEIKQEVQTVSHLSSTIKELIKFADLTLTDSTDINELILFKEIDTSGTITETNVDRAVSLYKKMTKRKQVTSLPIFEVKDTNTTILMFQGAGFGGAIWAKVLVDRNTMKIKKIAFEHKAESEGYGAALTLASFENQFIGMKINLEKDTFTLQRGISKIKDNGQIIDGISGATMTNQGVVEMLNQGIKSYHNYLKP